MSGVNCELGLNTSLEQSVCLRCMYVCVCVFLTDVGLSSVMKGQTELEVVKLKDLPQLMAKGLSTLHSPVLETLNLKCSGITSEGVCDLMSCSFTQCAVET